MKRFYKKLKSDSGASLVFALLVFLLCALTGTVALTAASANAGRYTHLEEEQKQYFSVASALELLQGQMDKKGSITITVEYVETESWHYENIASSGEEPKYDLRSGIPSYAITLTPRVSDLTYFSDLTYYQALLLLNNVPEQWWVNAMGGKKPDLTYLMSITHDLEYTIDPSDTNKDSLYPVKVTVKKGMDDANYALEMYLTVKDGDAYPLKVVWTADPVVTTETKVETTGEVNPAPTNPIDPDSTGTRVTTTTLTCKLKWSAADRVVTFE